jgi:hypothetical protein
MRKFKVFYQDNSGLKCEFFEGTAVAFEDRWFILYENSEEKDRIVIAIPTEMIYYIEEV